MKYSSASVSGGRGGGIPGSFGSLGFGRFSLMIRAGAASIRKSKASCPLRAACSDRTIARKGASSSSELTWRMTSRSWNA